MVAKTILLKGDSELKEAPASGIMTPGHLIARDVNGAVKVHAVAAGNAQTMFARENELAGTGIDVDYAIGENASFLIAERGSEVNSLIAAGAPAIVIGDKLESAGDGTLRKVLVSAATSDAQRKSIIGEALEAVDNSAGATPARLKMEVY